MTLAGRRTDLALIRNAAPGAAVDMFDLLHQRPDTPPVPAQPGRPGVPHGHHHVWDPRRAGWRLTLTGPAEPPSGPLPLQRGRS